MTQITDADRMVAEECARLVVRNATDFQPCTMFPSDADNLSPGFAVIIAQHRIDREKRLVEALRNLEQAESNYRALHDRHGGDSAKAGLAWDIMKRLGNSARRTLTQLGYKLEKEDA